MRLLFDTSVLIAAIVEAHPAHAIALPWLQKAKRKEVEFVVAAHSLLEVYSVLTRAPFDPPISAPIAGQLIETNIKQCAQITALTAAEYGKLIDDLIQAGHIGGIVYDALIVRCAEKAKVDQIITLNPKDFQRLWPKDKIVKPQ